MNSNCPPFSHPVLLRRRPPSERPLCSERPPRAIPNDPCRTKFPPGLPERPLSHETSPRAILCDRCRTGGPPQAHPSDPYRRHGSFETPKTQKCLKTISFLLQNANPPCPPNRPGGRVDVSSPRLPIKKEYEEYMWTGRWEQKNLLTNKI